MVETGTQDLTKPGVHYDVKRICTHCDYNQQLLHNDIALLHLNSTIVLDEKTQIIALPVQAMEDDDDVLLTGWGALTSAGGGGRPKLQKIYLKYVQLERCKELWDNDSRLHADNICTFTQKGEGVCYGDSGWPLISNGHIVDVVSWAKTCTLGFPDAHASPHFYLDWICQTMRGNKKCSCNA
ncbi:chymotrypsin-1-like [Glossina fuscipes]|uniref:Chymotrypsin-1-like n=1 Tax=Glossina fuscipes TaxID=7396 RepID=A0A9C5ZP88_9MUSC|nr:chymotrypsin-1-like [Glossina fuscipes]